MYLYRQMQNLLSLNMLFTALITTCVILALQELKPEYSGNNWVNIMVADDLGPCVTRPHFYQTGSA